MSTYVLIHGAWHDGSCWDEVATQLRTAGHEVHTPTLAGQGRGDVSRAVGHADAVASAAEAIVGAELRDIVLVGHSYGGTVISKLAELMPERIRRLVYLNAFVLLDGESVYDVSPPHYNALMDAIAGESEDGTVVLPYPVWREGFMNDASDALARSVYDEHLSPHPVQCFRDKVELKAFPALEIPRSVPQLHRGHRNASRRARLAPPLLVAPRPVPARPDAGRARDDVYESEPCSPPKLQEAGRD